MNKFNIYKKKTYTIANVGWFLIQYTIDRMKKSDI